jgi:dTDP-4-amino-4,6-dideoxygalactose transaminase
VHQQGPEIVPYLSVARQHRAIADEIAGAVEGVLRHEDRWLPLQRLESELASFFGVRHAIAVASGTDALTIALCALELAPGAAIVTSAFGFFATIAAILRAGATPRFVDIDLRTFTLNLDQALSHLDADVRVVLPVHLFGFALDVSPFVTTGHSIVVEDAAQAFGAKRNGLRAGTFGIVGALSFNWSKNLSSVGNGGALLTNDDEIAHRARVFSNYGMSESFTHSVVGLNSRMDPLEAAILSVKLRYLDAWNERRIAIAARYETQLSSVREVRTPHADGAGTHVFHKYAILAQNRDELRTYLAARGVETMVFYPIAQHRQPCLANLADYAVGHFPHTDTAVSQVLCLPIFPELTDAEIDYVADCIVDFYLRQGSPQGAR